MALVALVLSIAIPAPAWSEETALRMFPGEAEAGINLAFVSDSRNESGGGIGAHVDWALLAGAGPGYLTVGATAVHALADDQRAGCNRVKSLLMTAGRIRYVLEFSPRVKPYAGVGLGVHAVARDEQRCDQNPREGDDDLSLRFGAGVPLVFGVDFARESLGIGAFASFYQTDADARFGHVGVGVRWPF